MLEERLASEHQQGALDPDEPPDEGKTQRKGTCVSLQNRPNVEKDRVPNHRTQHNHVHTMEYFSATKRGDVPAHARTRMNLGNSTLRGKMPNTRQSMIPSVCNIQNRRIHGTERLVVAWGWERGGDRE